MDRLLPLLGLLLFLGACTTAPENDENDTFDASRIPAVVPKSEPPSQRGNPRTYEVFGRTYTVTGTSERYREKGYASWYGPQFHGRPTSSGTPFDMYQVSAAHKSLPIPTYVRVTNLKNNRTIVVRINDRGPFVNDRIIDLSYAAATKLDMVNDGIAPVEVVALQPYQYLPGFPYDNPNGVIALETISPGTRPMSRPAPDADLRFARQELPDNQIIAQDLRPAAFATPTSATPQLLQPVPVAVGPKPYLQVGAFGERHNAAQLQNTLAQRLEYSILLVKQNDLYRVRIGPLPGQTAPWLTLTAQLAAMGLERPHVIYK